MDYETLKWEQRKAVAYLTISRPKSLNALNLKVLEELDHCLSHLDKQSVRVLIIQGAGDKAFVAGADIKEMSELTAKEAEEFSNTGQRIFSLLENLPFPVIALIQGFALGGGLELALACDILILEENSKIGLPEVTLGLFPSFGGTQRLTRAVGFYKAKEMIFSGNFYTAQSAYNMGLANHVLSKDQLEAKLEEYAETFQKRGPLAIAKAKKLIQNNKGLNLALALKEEAKEFGILFDKEDSREGMHAFIEKRSPQFKGI
ncbi:MAG: enoyl-CoA hydratase-related protein [Bdellovibrionaceae bacterium]|nr:enoyl-CoA hydratase-related protein [Pseudobdellovibrionaceae bacterium]